ncbi:hypothetical protein Kpho02_54080 [Kitasatospora phosalacinea]|uniref:Uncharacterized protein n=1 Tax=Kitasatospora phosalacinea TaxID=2065 RepID=A0A9W6QBE0_9ACTN|nr:hypothetical protein [Kitasatospora phosalacinea]GLW73109.1 hypothetical protein Kpho02_54080 [Kitasatospora phosalacinea]
MSLTRVLLTSGRSIRLDEVRMSSTYGGLLEGYPCRRVNDWSIRSLRDAAVRQYPSLPVHLVEPVRELPEDGHRGLMGPEERLPLVRCVGLFSSHPVGRDDADFSQLVVAWYQPGPELADLAAAVPGLAELPWDGLARDCDY